MEVSLTIIACIITRATTYNYLILLDICKNIGIWIVKLIFSIGLPLSYVVQL